MLTPAPPPPPPPPSHAGASTTKYRYPLTEETKHELAGISDLVARLSPEERQRTYTQYESAWKKAKRELISSIETEYRAKTLALRDLQDEIEARGATFEAQRAALEAHRQSLLAQQAQYAEVPFLHQQIDVRLNEHPEKIRQLEHTIQAQLAADTALYRTVEADCAALKRELDNAERAVYQYYVRREAFRKAAHLQQTAASTNKRSKRAAIDINSWFENGLLSGLTLENLMKFFRKNEDVSLNANRIVMIIDYSPANIEKLKSLLRTFIKFHAPDERILLGIASGYITRDYNDPNTAYFLNEYKPYENVVYNAEALSGLEFYLQSLYRLEPGLAQTASVPLSLPAASSIDATFGIDAVAQSIQGIVASSDRAAQNAHRKHPLMLSSALPLEDDSRPANKAKQFAALEKHRQEIDTEARASDRFAKVRARQEKIQFSDAPDQSEMPPLLGTYAALSAEMRRVAQENWERLENILALENEDPNIVVSAAVQTLEAQTGQLRELQEQLAQTAQIQANALSRTPDMVLRSGGTYAEALACYRQRNNGRSPSKPEQLAWGQAAGFKGKAMTTYRLNFT